MCSVLRSQSDSEVDFLSDKSFNNIDSVHPLIGSFFKLNNLVAVSYEIIILAAALLSWLDDLDRFGLVLLENAPPRMGPVADLQASLLCGGCLVVHQTVM